MDIEENRAADAELKADFERLEARIDELNQEEEELSSRLDALQIQRKRYDSLRGHFLAVLNRKEILESGNILESTPPEQRRPPNREKVSQADQVRAITASHQDLVQAIEIGATELESTISLHSEQDYDQGRRSIVRGKGDTIAAAVFEILKDREHLDLEDRPVHYRNLVQAIEDRGIYVSGRDPGLNMIAHIHKDERFHRPRRGFYGLTEWYPASARRAGERTSRRNLRR